MTCRPCTIVAQFILNVANLADHAGNTLLLGDANETLSARTARARNAGSRAAAVFCSFLTLGQRAVTFGRVKRDHCQYALDASVLPNSKEIWDWTTGKIRTAPKTIIEDVEIAG